MTERKRPGERSSQKRRHLRATIADQDEQLSAFRRTAAELTRDVDQSAELDSGHLLDNVPALLAFLGPDGCYRFANRLYRETFDLTDTEILGKHYEELLPRGLTKKVQKKIEEALQGRDAASEVDINDPELGRRWMQVRYVPRLDEKGVVAGLCVLATDVTDLKAAQEAQRESQERYRAIVEAFEGLIYICSPDYRVEYMNQRFIDRTGYDGTGQLCYQVIHERQEICPWCVNKEVLSGKTTRWEVKSPKDDRWYYVVNTPIRHANGSVSKQSMILDITHRRLAEEELKASEEKYNKLFQHSNDGIILHDEPGIILDANARALELLGYDLPTLLATNIRDLHAPGAQAQLGKAFQSITDTGTASFEVEFLRKDLSTFPAEVSSSLFEVGGKPVVQSMIRDISERRRAERERVELERRFQHAQKLESLGVLAGGIAHDFNNLLTGVVGHADLALQYLSTDVPPGRYVQEIRKTAEQLADLTDQMLAYSGKGQFLVRSVSLSQVVEDMKDLVRVSISKRANITYDLAADLAPVDADVVQLRQVIMNLLTNASEALKDGTGDIQVTTGIMDADRVFLTRTALGTDLTEGRYAFLQVSDTGEGMDDDTQERIFEPFFTSKATGRGLGLAAVQGIMQGHGGTIDVESRSGRGSAFTLVFPLSQSPPTEAREVGNVDLASRLSGTILIVDDEPVIIEVAGRMLAASGFHVLSATNGRDALAILRAHMEDVSLVLLDLTLPHMDGMAIYREIRKLSSTLPVVLASGFSEQEAVRQFEGQGEGLAGFIQKPFRMAVLLDAIRHALEGRS
jgi:PAS domain S-box-containing protein